MCHVSIYKLNPRPSLICGCKESTLLRGHAYKNPSQGPEASLHQKGLSFQGVGAPYTFLWFPIWMYNDLLSYVQVWISLFSKTGYS